MEAEQYTYPYRANSIRPALMVIGGAAVLAVSLPGAGWRLLALLAMTGPFLWLIDELARRRRTVRLATSEVVIEQPLPIFTRVIAYNQIMGMLTSDEYTRPAIAYRRPPRQPGLPHRLGLVGFAPLEDEADFWEKLRQRAPAGLVLDAAQVARRLRGRCSRRRMLWAALLLLTPFVVILLAQTVRMFS